MKLENKNIKNIKYETNGVTRTQRQKPALTWAKKISLDNAVKHHNQLKNHKMKAINFGFKTIDGRRLNAIR